MAELTCPVCEGSFEGGQSTLAECPHCHVRFLVPGAEEAVLLTRSSKKTPDKLSPVPIPPELRSKYRFGRLLGGGGMGTVYMAAELETGTVVAIKFLGRPDRRDDLARFLRERSVLYRIAHPNVVRVIEAGAAGRHPYLVLEYVDGGTLKDRMEKAGRLPPPEAVAWMLQILAGLQACHDEGVVHRDLKPANVLLSRDGVAKVADLGVAKDALSDGWNLTKAGVLIGTPRYMSPEVLCGEPAVAASDVYSAGVLLYEMLSGEAPYVGDNPFQIARRMQIAPPRPIDEATDGIGPELSACVMRALAHGVTERTPSAAVFAAELRRALAVDDKGRFSGTWRASAVRGERGAVTRLGAYELIRRIGVGGTAAVYAARSAELGEVAIKIFKSEICQDRPTVQRFRQRAPVLRSVTHPSLVPVLDAGEASGRCFLVMPLVAHPTLERKLVETGPIAVPGPVVEPLLAVARVLVALEALHSRGVVHRDVTPHNVFVTGPGQAQLCDFGIIEILGPESILARSGALASTLPYLSPEQLAGEAVTPATDLYQVGLLIYRMVAGKLPFSPTLPSVIQAACGDAPLPDPRSIGAKIPGELADVVLRAVAHSPASRFASATEFATALVRMLKRYVTSEA